MHPHKPSRRQVLACLFAWLPFAKPQAADPPAKPAPPPDAFVRGPVASYTYPLDAAGGPLCFSTYLGGTGTPTAETPRSSG